jgi:predicted ribosomally synthesized peptide with SipW-like signal peptide
MLLVAVGLIAVAAGGSGTFASFSAETANNGNYFATGTLFLHATKQGGNTCKSEIDSGNSNITANGCDLLFNVSQLSAGQSQTVNLQLANAGSINASALKFALGSACVDEKPTIATTSGTVSTGGVTSIGLSGLNQPLVAGTVIDVTDGTTTDTFTVATSVASGASSVTVTGTSANTYSAGANVKVSATFGSANLCSGLQFYIQETDTGWSPNTKCVFGGGVGTTCSFGAQTVSGITTTPNDLTSSLWTGSTNASAIDAGNSRYFTLAIKAPTTFTNTQQNAQARFDLKWRIDQ